MFFPVLGIGAPARAGDVGFVEDFSLAKDRSVPLKTLIPGTEDYYYYHCLNFQGAGQLDEVDKMLTLWIARYNRTPRVIEIENRQALLRYDKDPRNSLDFIIRRLNLQFNHQRVVVNERPDLPTSLDPKLISVETLMARALANSPQTTAGIEDRGLELLAGKDLDGDRRREMLGRINRPDFPGLVKLILDDLGFHNSGGFGSIAIHHQLTLAQMEELVKAKPALLNEENFINAYLAKLLPSDDVDARHARTGRKAHLDRMWAFVSRLAPAHNSLKANVLYQRLEFDRSQGVWDADRFMAYIQLPRPSGYINAKYLAKPEFEHVQVDMNANYADYTLAPPIGNDEPLVRSYLLHFFVEAENFDAYRPYIDDQFLKQTFAEAKIVNGIGDMEKWYSMLPPEAFQALKDRIDLDLAWTNKVNFAADEAVTLKVDVKNVSKLIVKVYPINAMNYYRATLAPIGTDIDLDGLVANEESTKTYTEPPLRRVTREFPLDSLKKPGVYIVEFIGNGRSSRALVQKGSLHYLLRTGAAGQVFTILGEDNKPVPEAHLWLAGHDYLADKNGRAVVPFSSNPVAHQPVILSAGDVVSLAYYDQQGETYKLHAGFYVDRESLLGRHNAQAKLIVRPVLQAADERISLGVLENVVLSITSTDIEGVSTVKEVPDFKLFDNKETVFVFRVPDNLLSIAFSLRAKVQNLSQGKKVDVSDSGGFTLNGIDTTAAVQDLHLVHADGKYFLDLLGKTGEPRADRGVGLAIKHEAFKEAAIVALRSDQAGRVALGDLAGIEWIIAKIDGGPTQRWVMARDLHSYPQVVGASAGEAIYIPYMGRGMGGGMGGGMGVPPMSTTGVPPVSGHEDHGQDARETHGQDGHATHGQDARETHGQDGHATFSLLELRGQTFVADCLDKLKIEDGFVVIEGLAGGDYDLFIKDSQTHIILRVVAGPSELGYALGGYRNVELTNPHPLQIVSVQADKDTLTIQLANAGKTARVHLAATKYMPEYSIFEHLFQAPEEPATAIWGTPQSLYVSGRNIGDEYRYILDRKYAKVFPGNLLGRPGLLLNPWAIRKTETGQHEAESGEAYTKHLPEDLNETLKKLSSQNGWEYDQKLGIESGSNLDYLNQPSVVLADLTPDDKGVVTVKLADLGAHQQLCVLAVDDRNVAVRELSLPEVATKPLDLRLDEKQALDPKQHYTEQKQIGALTNGQKLTLVGGTPRLELYDSVARVYRLYMTLNNDPKLVEFSFILNWPKMKMEEKQAKYSEFACHELNFFLAKKDPAFFEKVIQPSLRNKKDKTFMDHYLLADDLGKYLLPWAYAQLNTAERILLGQRLADEQAKTARHVSDLYDLIPPDIERFNFLFKTAIQSTSLDTGDRLGMHHFDSENRITSRSETPRDIAAAQGKPEAEAKDAAPAEKAPAAPAAAAGAPPAKAAAMLTGKGKGEALERAKKSLEKLDELQDSDRAMDVKNRSVARQFYRKLEETQEWVENNYYHLPIENQNGGLVTVNGFWLDYAKRDPKAPFLSKRLAEAGHNFTEMMLAMAVLDIPFEPAKHDNNVKDAAFTLTAGSDMVAFYKEIKPTAKAAAKSLILVSQNYYRADDRYAYKGNQKEDKYVTDEFLIGVVYGCQIVVTNPTSSPMKLDLLLQVPQGSLPVSGGLYTRDLLIDLGPYSTKTADYFFYFPSEGQFPHYPVQVARNEELEGSAAATTLKVVRMPTKVDTTSWDYISQNGKLEDVLRFLADNNIDRLGAPGGQGGLDKIAWRMKDKDFFDKVIGLLSSRHVYNDTLWSYGLLNNVLPAAREYLRHRDDFVAQCGLYIDTSLLSIDPVERRLYQHMEYAPLVNARAHKLGKDRKVLNDRFYQQYMRLMAVLSYRPKLDDDDLMAVTYYMLLQDRVEEGLNFLAQVKPEKLPEQIQYDYFTAYTDFYKEDVPGARKIAAKYADYGVDRWRKLFANVGSQLDEIEGKAPAVADDKNRTQTQSQLAASEPAFEVKVESGKVAVAYQNISAFQVNYYKMDVELLFSKNPFVQQYSSQFSYVSPNQSDTVNLPVDEKKSKGAYSFDLPEKLRSSNVMVEIVAAGVKKSQAYYANSLSIQVMENYGQVKVANLKGAALAKVYVKVYARMKDGSVKFYKDGYTDLRGRFDYSSLNTNESEAVDRFAILVVSESDGAAVREAAPPKQ
jgi:hypothetical protein